jgi:hypothetical protein
MAFNPMMNPNFGGGMPAGPGMGGGLMGQVGRGMQDGSLVGRERGIAANAVMDSKMTEAMAKMDGVVTPQERMAIMQKKFKASATVNGLRSNGMGNVSGEAMARKQMGGGFPGGPGGFGGGFGGPGFGGPGFGGGFGPQAIGGVPGVGAQPLAGGGNVSMSMAWSTGGNATAQAGNAIAQAGPNGAVARAF